MLQGHGRNNPPYQPGFHNAPGGVCNGVTSGFDDEADIAFRPMPWAERQGAQLAVGRAVDAARRLADARAGARRHRRAGERCSGDLRILDVMPSIAGDVALGVGVDVFR